VVVVSKVAVSKGDDPSNKLRTGGARAVVSALRVTRESHGRWPMEYVTEVNVIRSNFQREDKV
jgi:hypothetical protein